MVYLPFFVNSETKSPSSTLTEQVPRESFSTVCLDFRITTTKAHESFMCTFSSIVAKQQHSTQISCVNLQFKIAKRSLEILNTISLMYYLVVLVS